MTITFEDLKKNRDNPDFLIDYFNNFDGQDVHEKFLNILISWENDVSYDISFSIDEKNIKIQLSYLISELKKLIKEPINFKKNDISFVIDIPKFFIKDDDVFSIENFITKIKHLNLEIDFSKISENDKKEVVKQLPANIYNDIIKFILKSDKKVILSNPSLKNMEINFLSNTPYKILEGLFLSYSKDYFRDIIYHLSKKIDGQILMKSTMMDIEYYLDKLSNDNSNDQVFPNLA
jgi:hypothetical protein